MRRVLLSLACACTLMFLTTPGFSQAIDGSLVGTVVDASGSAVPNVTVNLENMATGVKTSAKTNAGGEYRFNNILIGRYKLTASATGFTSTSLANVAVELNKTSTANLTLQVGSVSTTVEVSEAAAT